MVDIVSNCIKLDGEERSAGRGLSCAGPVTFVLLIGAGEGKQLRDSVLLWLSRITSLNSPNSMASKPFLSICSDVLLYWKGIRDDYL
jgi:hypothetical protein